MVTDRICLNAVCDLEDEKKGNEGKGKERGKSERGDLRKSLRLRIDDGVIQEK